MSVQYPLPAEVERQLVALLTAQMLDPLEIWLDSNAELNSLREGSIAAARNWANRLLSSHHDDAVHAIVQLLAVFYPSDNVFDPPLNWWATPLGRITVHRIGHPGATAVSYATAGAMLGISRQGVHDLVKRGKLAMSSTGGVATAAIQQRLNQTIAR